MNANKFGRGWRKLYQKTNLPHDTPSTKNEGRAPVTVCLAALFRWNYGTLESPDFKSAAVVISDRMITAGDIQYEPNQLKLAAITPKVLVLIAGDYSLHSQAIKDTAKQVKGDERATPQRVSIIYGRCIQAIKQKMAEDLYLAPFGMNSDTFLAQQGELSQSFVDMISSQLQSYRGDEVEALVVGIDDEVAQLYHVDTRGSVFCLDDVGFGAIGSGSWHARSFMMQTSYSNHVGFAQALASTFAAKKSAEIAPGVGEFTDICLILKSGWTHLPIETSNKLHEIYDDYNKKRLSLISDAVGSLQEFINTNRPNTEDGAHGGQERRAEGRQEDYGSPSSTAAEASQRNEAAE